MKVLMITNMYPSEEYPSRGIFIKSQIDSIAKEGIDVDLMFIDAWESRSAYIKAIAELRKRLRYASYDIVHAHYGFSGLVARMQFQVPLLVSFCGGDILGNPNAKGKKTLSSRLYTVLSQILALMTPAVIVKSKEMQRRLMKQKDVYIIPNGVDFQRFIPMRKSEVRKRLGLDLKKKYVLFPSNARWIRKRYDLARDAVSALKEHYDIELITLYHQAPECVPSYMNACDAVIMTSLWEGSPNVIKEAMACNTPIVSVDVGDVKQIIADCEGCYLSKRTVSDLARNLEYVIQVNKKTAGRNRVENLEIQKTARKIIQIYRRLHHHQQKKEFGTNSWKRTRSQAVL